MPILPNPATRSALRWPSRPAYFVEAAVRFVEHLLQRGGPCLRDELTYLEGAFAGAVRDVLDEVRSRDAARRNIEDLGGDGPAGELHLPASLQAKIGSLIVHLDAERRDAAQLAGAGGPGICTRVGRAAPEHGFAFVSALHGLPADALLADPEVKTWLERLRADGRLAGS